MNVWSSCRIEVRAGDELELEGDDCDVRLEDGKLTLTYFDSEGPLVFIGLEEEDGRFDLICRSRPRRGTLHRTGDTLTGSWQERDETGSWTVALRK